MCTSGGPSAVSSILIAKDKQLACMMNLPSLSH